MLCSDVPEIWEDIRPPALKKMEIDYACCRLSFDQKNIYPSPYTLKTAEHWNKRCKSLNYKAKSCSANWNRSGTSEQNLEQNRQKFL